MGLSLDGRERIGQIVAFIYSLSPTQHGDFFLLHPHFSRDFPLATSLHMTELKSWARFPSLFVCSSFENQSSVRSQAVFRESMTGKMEKRNLSLQDTGDSWESVIELREFKEEDLACLQWAWVSTRMLPDHHTELHTGHPVGLQRSSHRRGH